LASGRILMRLGFVPMKAQTVLANARAIHNQTINFDYDINRSSPKRCAAAPLELASDVPMQLSTVSGISPGSAAATLRKFSHGLLHRLL
jgi:hypothetical protein